MELQRDQVSHVVLACCVFLATDWRCP